MDASRQSFISQYEPLNKEIIVLTIKYSPFKRVLSYAAMEVNFDDLGIRLNSMQSSPHILTNYKT